MNSIKSNFVNFFGQITMTSIEVRDVNAMNADGNEVSVVRETNALRERRPEIGILQRKRRHVN